LGEEFGRESAILAAVVSVKDTESERAQFQVTRLSRGPALRIEDESVSGESVC
jgi:hypothetical protein